MRRARAIIALAAAVPPAASSATMVAAIATARLHLAAASTSIFPPSDRACTPRSYIASAKSRRHRVAPRVGGLDAIGELLHARLSTPYSTTRSLAHVGVLELPRRRRASRPAARRRSPLPRPASTALRRRPARARPIPRACARAARSPPRNRRAAGRRCAQPLSTPAPIDRADLEAHLDLVAQLHRRDGLPGRIHQLAHDLQPVADLLRPAAALIEVPPASTARLRGQARRGWRSEASSPPARTPRAARARPAARGRGRRRRPRDLAHRELRCRPARRRRASRPRRARRGHTPSRSCCIRRARWDASCPRAPWP